MATIASAPVDEALLQGFSDSVAARMGLHFPCERWPELWRGCCDWAAAAGASDAADCMREWMATPPQRDAIEALATHLAIGETYFFREPACFDTLRERILPPLIAARRSAGHMRLRLWSAGCASGEEAYSLAILLSELIPDLHAWDVRILATDIHPGLLDTARQGIYGEWSFRGQLESIRDAHFERLDEARWQLRACLRELVDVEHLNLADPAAWGLVEPMDLVLCRHVLMYFEPRQAKRLMARLHAVLGASGWLVTASIEGLRPHTGFDELRWGGGVFYRKRRAPALLPQPPVVVLPETPPARAHIERDQLEEILSHCRAALLSDRCNAELHQLQALVHEELGQLDEARCALRRALFLDPGCVVAHLALGRLFERQGQPEQAQRHIANALELLRRRAVDASHLAAPSVAETIAELLARLQDPVA